MIKLSRPIQVIGQNALQVSLKTIVRLIQAHNSMEQGTDHEARLKELFLKQGKKKVHFCPNWHYTKSLLNSMLVSVMNMNYKKLKEIRYEIS